MLLVFTESSRRKRSHSLDALIACCKSIFRKNDWWSQEDNKESREDSCWRAELRPPLLHQGLGATAVFTYWSGTRTPETTASNLTCD